MLFGTLWGEDLSCSGVLVGGSEPNGSEIGREVAAVTGMVDVFGWAISIGWSHVETAARARREVLTSAAFEVAGVGADGWTFGFGLVVEAARWNWKKAARWFD